ncbi:hypothetical protein CI109_103937 [Kwoniella shandongensis]|uniref:RNA polymerase II subunit A C-terminal domain phosphatase n=1 Tax=Kwoniella shandongensis TaxID=1734106 RepID=A0A5M6BTD8_9TREE|nr:uncharacterized protein CI109_005609 [Kwoniella shandongensis]KAA5526013.1 hypothetical protein CI109_005609 [Kwoniella shandongensis]
MSDPPTQLSLPSNLPFPIRITRLIVHPGDNVRRGSRLLEYSFMSNEQRAKVDKRHNEGRTADLSKGEFEGDDLSGTWESLIEGEVVGWLEGVTMGMVIERRQASRPLLNVQQPCSHPVQLHGMCGICGADLTEDDYLSAPAAPSSSNQAGPSRYPGGFEVTHDAMGVTVSKNEAQRLDNLTRDALLSTRRLSLIVDLDQTIIHTTVDPTVAEWMEEIEADRAAQTEHGHSPDGPANSPPPGAEGDPESTTPPGSPAFSNIVLPPKGEQSPQKEKNPNAEALQDVARFQISDDLPPGYVKPKQRRTRPGERPVEAPGRWYFTKPRPGLQKFLDEMSELYEMHVYTMGTRTYADAICKVIDPEGKIFGGRVLSRDESGSFSSKNLKRLFPTDTSMVVVIDDRSDVWGDCPNLVKVVPYDFFIGIGDINSAFLPKQKSTPGPSPAAASPSVSPLSDSPASPSSSSAASSPPPATPEDESLFTEEELLLKAKMLDEVSEARPLAKLQEELEKEEEMDEPNSVKDAPSTTTGGDESSKATNDAEASTPKSKDKLTAPSAQPDSPVKPRKPLLNPNDYELLRVSDILGEIHRRFYDAYDDLSDWDSKTKLPMSCDVEFIIPELKGQVLEGCNLVFSGVIPQSVDPVTSDIWQTAETFGALCSTAVNDRTTHCVTATLDTEKTYRTSKVPGAKVVWTSWFWDSVALWRRQPEVKYLAGAKSRTPSPPPPDNKSTTPPVDATDDTAGQQGNEDMEDDTNVGTGWDESADKEWEAFMAEDDSDYDASDVASVASIDSVPSTPSKKRVRYADEESLPLEDFKDPSPEDILNDPPTKRRKPLLLEATPPGEEIPPENRIQYKPRGFAKKDKEKEVDDDGNVPVSIVQDVGIEGEGVGEEEAGEDGDGGDEARSEAAETEGDDEDEFARMLRESMAEEEGEEDAEADEEEEF